MEENRNENCLSLPDEGEFEEEVLISEDTIGKIPEETDEVAFSLEEERILNASEEQKKNERREYEELIKNRFKELYAEDTQRLINRRFRKYKIMEERFKLLEEKLAAKEAELLEGAKKAAEFEELLRREIERTAIETEERVVRSIRAKKLRPGENGAVPRKTEQSFDVSKLTKNDRATLAKRAADGEIAVLKA